MKKLTWHDLKTCRCKEYHLPTDKKSLKDLDSNKNPTFNNFQSKMHFRRSNAFRKNTKIIKISKMKKLTWHDWKTCPYKEYHVPTDKMRLKDLDWKN